MQSKNGHAFLDTHELRALVAQRHDHKSYVVLDEVRDSTGFGGSRSCDMIVMATWPSHGFRISGFEVKRDRSDWLRELKQPDKANEMMRYCDEWIVVANRGVVDLAKDHVPDAWGVWEPTKHGTKLVTVKTPIIASERGVVDRGFLAALLRRATRSSLSEKEKAVLVVQIRAEAQAKEDSELRYLQSQHDALKKAVEEFEKKSGLYIRAYNAGDIGAAVTAVRNGAHHEIERRLHGLQEHADGIARDIKKYIEKLAAV